MRVLNFGSLNIDMVFSVEHIVQPGETISSQNMQRFAGGKGANQSVALAHAGAAVAHAGAVGPDGLWLIDTLRQHNIDTRFIQTTAPHSGQAIIQVDVQGQNAILLLPGANHQISTQHIQSTLAAFADQPTLLLLQNEINAIDQLILQGKQQNMQICFNPAPFTPHILQYPLHLLDILILNHIEGQSLTHQENPKQIISSLARQLPHCQIILTLGSQGVLYHHQQHQLHLPAHPVKPIDTTAAGDTFLGFYLAGICQNLPATQALEQATKAAAICITRPGAIASIPHLHELSSPLPPLNQTP